VRLPGQVFFTKQSKKKKKIWEDGVLVVKKGCMELQVVDSAFPHAPFFF